MQRGEPRRQADIYVLCQLKHKDQTTFDPLKMEQFDFYMLPTFELDHYKWSKSSITLNSLKKLVEPVKYSRLKGKIVAALDKQKRYL